jgi:hypothetical protein
MNDTTLVHVRDSNAPPALVASATKEIADYLDYAGSQLKERRAELIAALAANLVAHPTINDDEVLALIAENMRMAGALARTAEDHRETHKEPFWEGGKAIDRWFKTFQAPLAAAMAPVQAAMDAYGAAKLARQQAEAAAAAKLAQAEADRATDRAAQALREGRSASDALDAAADATARAEEADERAQARPADLTRVKSDYGAVASVRQKWMWRVVDLKKVPKKYTKTVIDEEAVKLAAKDRGPSGKPICIIPGIEFYPETRMGVR